MPRYLKAPVHSLALALSLLAISTGCRGPLMIPMVERLDESQQAKVDGIWSVMLDEAAPVDRRMLLDIVLLQQLHQFGVDSLALKSTKSVGRGYVVMEVRFERHQPELDEFSVAYIEADGRKIRRERFTRADIQDRVEFFTGDDTLIDQATSEESTNAQALRNAEREARMREIEALLGPIMKADEVIEEGCAPDTAFPLVIMPP